MELNSLETVARSALIVEIIELGQVDSRPGKKIHLTHLITHGFDLNQWQEAFEVTDRLSRERDTS